jgi:hypothetical protein
VQAGWAHWVQAGAHTHCVAGAQVQVGWAHTHCVVGTQVVQVGAHVQVGAQVQVGAAQAQVVHPRTRTGLMILGITRLFYI